MLKSVDEFSDKLERNRKNMEKKDQAAKKAGKLKGRFVEEPRADGYAIYEIIHVNKSSVRIRVVTGIGDDWIIPFWGEKATIPLDYAEQNIRRRDALAELFNKHKQKVNEA